MDDVTASIIIACQTAGAVNSISKLGFAFGMLGRKAIEFGAESIRIFSDLQEETQKFGTVFAGVQNEANKHVQELIDNFGQSELSARRMMAQTGDLLRGAGFDKSILTYLSSTIAKYGSDLTSFANYAGGAEQATFALTKMMLGEQEMAKSLGVFIKYDSKMFKDLEKQALSTGLAIGKNGEIIRARNEIEARALASFYEMVRQKSYVLGDYWRNQGSIANQSRKLSNRIDELKTTIGGFIDSVIRVGSIKGEFADTFESITSYIKENSAEWAYHVSSFLNIWRGGFEMLWTVAKNAFSNVAVVGKYVWESLVQAWSDAPGFFGAVWEDIKNIADNTRNVLVVDFQASFEYFGNVLHSFLKNWKSIFSDLWEITKRTVKSIVAYFVTGIKNLGQVASSLGENFWDLLTGKKKFSEAVGGVFDSYMNAFENIGSAVAKQWKGFEFGAGTKQFGKDVAAAFMDAQAKKMKAAAKLLAETGKNTERYLAKSGIKLGDFTSITAGIDDVIDEYHKRQKRIAFNTEIVDETAPTDVGKVNNLKKENFTVSLKSIAESINKFKETSQSAILANSVDALRLQSRVLTQSPEMKVQQSQLDTLKQIKNGIDRLVGPSRTAPNLVRS